MDRNLLLLSRGYEEQPFRDAIDPKYDLTKEISYIRQAYQYAHSTTSRAKNPEYWVWNALLTDFEEFRLFECLDPKPMKQGKEKLLNEYIVQPFDWTYENYTTDFDLLWDTFSRERVAAGILEAIRLSEAELLQRRIAPDDQFLDDLDGWREKIARSIWRHNRQQAHFSDQLLAAASQLILDRLIFVKTLADKGIEEDYLSHLITKVGNQNTKEISLYDSCRDIFRKLEKLYNGSVFAQRGELDAIQVGNRTIRNILRELLPQNSVYTLASLEVEILGNAYERFLGKQITSDGRGISINQKQEVIKAGGVYYTPSYVVEFIVERTIAPLLKRCRNPEEVAQLNIVDPSCGSGSFLIGVYDKLLRWYVNFFLKDAARLSKRGAKSLVSPKYRKFAEVIENQAGAQVVRLTAWLKKKILTDNIYGIDIDPQAVEVTRFSLSLRAMEGSDVHELHQDRSLFNMTILPDLSKNIRCGNSLIGRDIASSQPVLFTDDTLYAKLRPFDWDHITNGFPAIMQSGGFDAVVGNPPYVFTRELMTEMERSYYRATYSRSFEKHNTFLLFMEKMMQLLKSGGMGGYIVPNSWLTIENAKLIREHLLGYLVEICDMNYPVFDKVNMEPSIYVVEKRSRHKTTAVRRVHSESEFVSLPTFEVDKDDWRAAGGRFVFHESSGITEFLFRVARNSVRIGDLFDVRSGLQAYERGKGSPPQTKSDVKGHIYDRTEREDEDSYRYLNGKDVKRYSLHWGGNWMQYGPWLAQPREIEIFTRPRILIREITGAFPDCIIASYTDQPFLNNKSVLNVLHHDDDEEQLLLLLGILSSEVMSLYYKGMAVKAARKMFPKIVIRNLREFPFPKVNPNQEITKITSNVARMLTLSEALEQEVLQERCDYLAGEMTATSDELNHAVCELFGLDSDKVRDLFTGS